MTKIEVRCPICSKWDKIEIEDDATKNITKGLLAINITSGMICEHSFIAYIDNNLIIRDTFIADFKVETNESPITQEIKEQITLKIESMKFDLIKINFPKILMAYVFKAIFSGEKIVIISNQEFLYTHVINFFKYVMRDFFDIDIIIMSNEDYKGNKKDYKDYVVFRNREIIQDKKKLINPKKLEIEKSISHKFYSEFELVSALIILRNEIQKIYEFSKAITELIRNPDNKPLTSRRLIDYLKDKYGETIHISYLKLLMDIVNNYFKV